MTDVITTPVGRLVEGSLYKGNDRDADGNPLIYKSGKNAGQSRVDFYFAVAIPKGSEAHWNQTEWGQTVENVAKAAFPKTYQRHDFSWKITDGDSTVLNKANRRPCDKEGFPGHWIIRFSRPFSPKIWNADGTKQLMDEDVVNLGDYVQVHASVAGNSSDKTPGVYINHLLVAFSGYGERILLGPDARTVGFGQSPLPAGASTTPPPGLVVSHTNQVTLPSTPVEIPPAYPQILTVATPPPPPVVRVMLPAAQGLTYEQYKASGWTDEQMITNGIMSA